MCLTKYAHILILMLGSLGTVVLIASIVGMVMVMEVLVCTHGGELL